jgi:hypothetical protein
MPKVVVAGIADPAAAGRFVICLIVNLVLAGSVCPLDREAVGNTAARQKKFPFRGVCCEKRFPGLAAMLFTGTDAALLCEQVRPVERNLELLIRSDK